MDEFIAQTAERIFQDHAENSSGLWQALEENGLTRAWTPENLGGTGLELKDGFELIRQSARHSIDIPYTETLLASFLLSASGAETPDGQISIATTAADNTSPVPFAESATHVLRLHNNNLELIIPEKLSKVESISPEAISSINFSGLQAHTTVAAPDWMTPSVYAQLGALIRSAQLCGAMERQLELTLEHTATREQFGRPLTKFQAVQHLLSEIAGELASCTAALEGAIHSVSLDIAPDFMSVASAKIRASEAAEIVTKNAHQAHGAIGFTGEYSLGQFSRRLWQWREDFGNEFYWAKQLGEHITRPGSNGLTHDIFGASNA